jgi:hypothetical protein
MASRLPRTLSQAAQREVEEIQNASLKTSIHHSAGVPLLTLIMTDEDGFWQSQIACKLLNYRILGFDTIELRSLSLLVPTIPSK